MRAMWCLILLGIVAANNESFGQELENKTFHVPDLGDICENLNLANGIGEMCKEQLGVVCGNLTLFMAMLDASSKFPFTGLDYASKIDLGNFDQCMTIDHSYKGGRITGEYCKDGLVVSDPFKNTSVDGSTYYRLSVCRPDGCCASDYNEIVNNSKNWAFLDSRCQMVESPKTFTTSDIVTLAIFTVVIGLIVISTFYHMIIYKNLGNPHPLLVTFSILSNGRKFLHISKQSSKEQIETFNGLRVISMMWIVAGHAFMSWEKVPVVNRREEKIDWTESLSAGYITSAQLAVDTFFYMSGFLVAFRYLKSKEKSLKNQVSFVPFMYVQRYLRLTPALLMTYLMTISFFKHLGSGPLWVNIEKFGRICEENWWSTFLYIQNYYNYDKVCLPQTWFLSVLMQLFLLSPLVLIPLSLTLKQLHGFKKSMTRLLILNICCTFVPMAHKLLVTNYENEYDTQTRLIDYSIGITLAVVMREKIEKPFLYTFKESYRAVINYITGALILLTMLSIVICYQLIEMYDNYKVKAISYSLMRPVWCICLSWIVYSCYHGYGGLVNWILCRPIFQILGRLTYCIYLLHQSLIDYHVATTRAPWYFTNYHAFYLFCGHYLVSVIIATFWTLAFESPFIALEKYLVGGENETERDDSTRQIIYAEEVPQTNFTNNGNMENLSSNNMKVEELYRKNKEID